MIFVVLLGAAAVLVVGVSEAAAQDGVAAREETEATDPVVTLPFVQAPVAGEPKTFVPTRWADVLYQEDDRIVSLDSGAEQLRLKDEDPAFAFHRGACHTGDGSYLGCGQVSVKTLTRTYVETKTRQVGNKTETYEVTHTVTYYHTRASFIDNKGRYQQLVTVEDSVPHYTNPSLGTRYDIQIHGLYVDAHNRPTLLYEVTRTTTRPGKTQGTVEVDINTEELIWRNGRPAPFTYETGAPITRESGSGAGHATRINPRLQFVEVDGQVCMGYAWESAPGPIGFQCIGQGADRDAPRSISQTSGGSGPLVTVVEEAMYDFRLMAGGDGWLYLFYHAPAEETTMVAVSRDGKTWQHTTLDTRESGWQMDAAVHGDEVYLLYYYFRNSFNKGLRMATLKGGSLKGAPVTIVREVEHNTGWYPFMAISPSGSLWMTYWDNVLEEHRVWSHLKDPSALSAHVIKDTGQWEDSYKNWALQAGAGGWYTLWYLREVKPSKEDLEDQTVGLTTYSLSRALLATTSLEAEFLGWSLSMSYARSIVEDAQKELDDATGGNISLLTGSLKIDKLFPGHDAKVQFVWGRYHGRAQAGNGVLLTGSGADTDGTLPINTDYVDAQAQFLNKWRIKYGLAVTRYTLPMALHTWNAPAGDAQYTYTGSFFRDTEVTDIKALVGYSTLDYISKYENFYSGLFIDGYIDGGVSLLRFDPVVVAGEEEDFTFTLVGRGTVHLGYLLFSRWRGARGLGFYLRPAYLAEGTFMGLPARPTEREDEKDLEEADTSISPGLLSVRHGPWLDLGVVW